MFEHLADLAPDEGPALRAEYRLRKRRMYVQAAAWMLGSLLTLIVTMYVWEPAGWLFIGGLIVHAVLRFRTWRCPRCGTGFGRRWWVDACPGCRLVLEEPAPPDEERGR